MADLIEPKNAAIAANVFTQQVYEAIANNLLQVERKNRRVYIVRKSFDRWRKNLRLRRRMRTEERQVHS